MVVPGFCVSPFCSEPGAVSASQDTRFQSACEGMPLPRPSVSPALAWRGQPQAYPPLGPLWTQLTRQLGSSGYSWIDPQPSSSPCRRALRAVDEDRGITGPKSTFLSSLPLEAGLFQRYFKCWESPFSFGEGRCATRALSTRGVGLRLCLAGPSPPQLSHMSQVQSSDHLLFLFHF